MDFLKCFTKKKKKRPVTLKFKIAYKLPKIKKICLKDNKRRVLLKFNKNIQFILCFMLKALYPNLIKNKCMVHKLYVKSLKKTYIRSYCIISGRSRSVYIKSLTRHRIKEYQGMGLIAGLKKLIR